MAVEGALNGIVVISRWADRVLATMKRAPSSFARPNLLWFLAFDGGIALMAFLAASEENHEAAAKVVPLPPRNLIQTLLALTFGIHVFEMLYARRQARSNGLPTGRWMLQTFAVGLPSLLKLRKVASAR